MPPIDRDSLYHYHGITVAEHAALLFHLGRGQLGDVAALLALIDDLYWQSDFETGDPTGALDERDLLPLRGACKLVAHHLQAAGQ